MKLLLEYWWKHKEKKNNTNHNTITTNYSSENWVRVWDQSKHIIPSNGVQAVPITLIPGKNVLEKKKFTRDLRQFFFFVISSHFFMPLIQLNPENVETVCQFFTLFQSYVVISTLFRIGIKMEPMLLKNVKILQPYIILLFVCYHKHCTMNYKSFDKKENNDNVNEWESTNRIAHIREQVKLQPKKHDKSGGWQKSEKLTMQRRKKNQQQQKHIICKQCESHFEKKEREKKHM